MSKHLVKNGTHTLQKYTLLYRSQMTAKTNFYYFVLYAELDVTILKVLPFNYS